MNIIQALKDNKEAFGLMSKEMQEAIMSIGKIEDIERMVCRVTLKTNWFPMSIRVSKERCKDIESTFRLRPDYSDEPEVVKCEVYADSNSLRYKRGPTDCGPIASACNSPDFIGFELDGQLWGRLYKHKKSNMFFFKIPANKLGEYEVCDMSEAHVLFRRTK